MPDRDAPIGVFDSGVGGLSVLSEIRRELPAEHLLYVADSGYAPYGERTPDFIQQRAEALLSFLEQHGAKAVVVACNTATGVAVDDLRARTTTPIVAIEPPVKPATLETKSGVIGVLATNQTLASPRFERLVSRYGSDVEVLVQPCPGLAEQVEKGELASRDTRVMVEHYVRPLIERGADTLVLGCTHYPFVRDVIQSIAGSAVRLIDPAVAVAREVRRRLQNADLLASDGGHGTERFFTTGDPGEVRAVIAQLWNGDAHVDRVG